MTRSIAETQIDTVEKLPQLSDSLALQTYEFFAGGNERKAKMQQFQDGATLEPSLDYPRLDETEIINQHLRNLQLPVWDPERVNDVSASPEYRLAESYFLVAAARFKNRGDHRPIVQSEVDQFQEMNEYLYGTPDESVTRQMLASVWEKLDRKKGGVIDETLREIEDGFVFRTLDGEELSVPPLPRPESSGDTDGLPQLDPNAYQWLHSHLNEQLAPAREVFETYASAKSDEEVSFAPEDVATLFEEALVAMGLNGIQIIRSDNATALSWSSADKAVHVGMERKPVTSVDELLGLFGHEVYLHGTRSIRGASLGDASLENGLFTEAEEGEDPSYLTFEEGLAAVVQKTVQDKQEKWDMASIGNYLNISLAHAGWSPRQIYEVMSRVRTVLVVKKDAESVSSEVLKKAQNSTMTQVVRVFRGTPTEDIYQTSDGVTLHYAKDLAYAAGKIKAIKLLNQLARLPEDERSHAWQRLICGKYDPTNRRQNELVAKYEADGRI